MSGAGRFLFVVTSQATLGEGGAPTGLWLEELAPPYYILSESGLDIDLASPLGGEAPVDPMCLGDPWISDEGRLFLGDVAAVSKLEDTLALDQVDPGAYEGVFLVGGAGAAWDFPANAALGRVLAQILAADKIASGICHGVAGFLNQIEGVALAKGRRVTCVSNAEEVAAGFDQVVPLFPQDALTSAGATVSCADLFEGNVVIDGNLLTGQNPASARPLALAIADLIAKR